MEFSKTLSVLFTQWNAYKFPWNIFGTFAFQPYCRYLNKKETFLLNMMALQKGNNVEIKSNIDTSPLNVPELPVNSAMVRSQLNFWIYRKCHVLKFPEHPAPWHAGVQAGSQVKCVNYSHWSTPTRTSENTSFLLFAIPENTSNCSNPRKKSLPTW